MAENDPEAELPDSTDEEKSAAPVPLSVQGAYVKALEESEKLLLQRVATEQLARQLGRGLRIRRSADQRVIRSPSARKIGAIRRRSRESPRLSLINAVIISKFRNNELTSNFNQHLIIYDNTRIISEYFKELLTKKLKERNNFIKF